MLSNAWLSSWDPIATPVEAEVVTKEVVKKRERPSPAVFEPRVIHVTFEEAKPFVAAAVDATASTIEPAVSTVAAKAATATAATRHVPDVIPSILEQRSGSRVQPERRTKRK